MLFFWAFINLTLCLSLKKQPTSLIIKFKSLKADENYYLASYGLNKNIYILGYILSLLSKFKR